MGDVNNLSGSKLNDWMKWRHKQLPFHSDWYASDIDLALINNKKPFAVIDYKAEQEAFTAHQKMLWKFLFDQGLPIYIVRVNNDRNKFWIFQITSLKWGSSGQWVDETCKLIKSEIDINGLAAWEGNLRAIDDCGF